jgi:tetratricopeptide (TPR) repeat protein
MLGEVIQMGEALHYLGVAQGEQREYDHALATLQRALSIREAVFGPESLPVGETVYRMAYVYQRRGDYATMGASLQRALPIYERTLGAESPLTADVLGLLGTTIWSRSTKWRARNCARARSQRLRATTFASRRTSTALDV